MFNVLSTMHWIPRARRHALRNLVKKYASVKYFVTKNASKVLYGGTYKNNKKIIVLYGGAQEILILVKK